MSHKTIALSMIVKDEAHVISRCLASVLPLIDRWYIADTGSTDDTKAVVRKFMADKPGEIFDVPWEGFARSRNRALDRARNEADYCLIIDADEVLVYDHGFEMPALTRDAYWLKTYLRGTEYWRRQLISNAVNWRYTGDVHEILACDDPFEDEDMNGLVNYPVQDSARNQTGNKYAGDVTVLERVLAENPDDPRTLFTLGQSYRDSGNFHAAVDCYRRRAEIGGDEDVVWFSYYQLGLNQEAISAPVGDIFDAYQTAFDLKPHRAEPIVRLIRYFIVREDFNTARQLLDLISDLPCPERDFLVERHVYTDEIPKFAQVLDQL